MSNQPVGIFDSGLGGLTVANAIARYLPNEQIIYFGDTAHCPWGDKSTAAIEHYATHICDALLEQNCKIIVVACNTASALVLNTVIEHVKDRAQVINVIDPVINYIAQHHQHSRLGLIGTRQTIRSQSYQKRIQSMGGSIPIHALATPLLVPLIEEGFANKSAASLILHEYLSIPELLNIQAMILGCTHYPLIKQEIDNFYDHSVDIIDSAQMTAEGVKEYLASHDLLASGAEPRPQHHFFVSDLTEIFESLAKKFFSQPFRLEPYPLWT